MAAKDGRFSWTRLFSNAFPVFANDSINDINLTPPQADKLFAHQITRPYPHYLTDDAFLVASIVDTSSQSARIHQSLIKHNIILPVPAPGSPETEKMTVNISAITKHFANQHPTISIHVQRKLVALLFFWEEECTRWRLLYEEEQEILTVMEEEEGMSGGARMDLGIALRANRMKKLLMPSDRAEGTANVGSGRGDVLPSYNQE